MKVFVNAYLRRTSGAAISKQEMVDGEDMFFPKPGDKPANVEQKRITRETALRGLYAEAGERAMSDARGTTGQSAEDAARLTAIFGS